ncbi:unnamed protein product [Lampetra planeri]
MERRGRWTKRRPHRDPTGTPSWTSRSPLNHAPQRTIAFGRHGTARFRSFYTQGARAVPKAAPGRGVTFARPSSPLTLAICPSNLGDWGEERSVLQSTRELVEPSEGASEYRPGSTILLGFLRSVGDRLRSR